MTSSDTQLIIESQFRKETLLILFTQYFFLTHGITFVCKNESLQENKFFWLHYFFSPKKNYFKDMHKRYVFSNTYMRFESKPLTLNTIKSL